MKTVKRGIADPTDELSRLVETVYHRASNAHTNHAALVAHEREETGNEMAQGEHTRMLGVWEALQARNLREAPSMRLVGRVDAGKYARAGTSHMTGRSCRWLTKVDFDFEGRKPTHTKAEHLQMSNASFAYWRAHLDILDEDSAVFAESFSSRGVKRNEITRS